MNKPNIFKQNFILLISCFLFSTITLSAQINIHTPIFVDKWGGLGSSIGDFNSPRGIVIDNQGNIYVVEQGNNRIQKFAPNGTPIAKWDSKGLFSSPEGITIDSKGNIYVADKNIRKFAPDGTPIAKWGGEGRSSGQFKNPNDIAIDSKGYIYVADYNNHRIQKFNSTGSFSDKWGKNNGNPFMYKKTQDEMDYDWPDPTEYIEQNCQLGSGNKEFSNPSGITIDNQENIYVVDMFNDRIQKFNSNMNYLAQWGGKGNGDGKFNLPHSMAIDNQGNIYVADERNNRIQKFDSNMIFLAKWGTGGSGDGEFSGPTHIAIDKKNNIYVVDSGNNRVQKFTTAPLAVLQGTWQEKANPANKFQIKNNQHTDLSTNKTRTIKTYVDVQLTQADPAGYYLAIGIGQNSAVWEFIQKNGKELEINPNPGQGALGIGGIIYVPYTPQQVGNNNQQAAANNQAANNNQQAVNNNQAPNNNQQAVNNNQAANSQHSLPGKTFHIKNTYGGASHPWYGAMLSWNNGSGGHPMAALSKSNPIKWEFQAVSGKANTYKIINTTAGQWKGASISWDNNHPHPLVSVESNDPVEWRMDPVAGKPNTYKIVSTFAGKWQGASISWDNTPPNPRASLEFNDPVEWELILVK